MCHPALPHFLCLCVECSKLVQLVVEIAGCKCLQVWLARMGPVLNGCPGPPPCPKWLNHSGPGSPVVSLSHANHFADSNDCTKQNGTRPTIPLRSQTLTIIEPENALHQAAQHTMSLRSDMTKITSHVTLVPKHLCSPTSPLLLNMLTFAR